MKPLSVIKASVSEIVSPEQQFANDILSGLCGTPKRLSSKYFYDDAGSEIFQKITREIDYYLTRTEYEILTAASLVIPKIINDEEIDIIELGAGDGHKSRLIIDGFLDIGCRVNYYPIDISEKAMVLLEKHIEPKHNLVVNGIVAEYLEGMRQVQRRSTNKKLVMFLGSNIGNFDHRHNVIFLQNLHRCFNNSDYVLLGFDLKKDIDTLTAAYNDSGGYTREFNLNLLKRINKELGGNFDTEKFLHRGIYSPVLGAMESFLISAETQDVYISALERHFSFKAHEPIHMEYSYKFLESDIDDLSCEAGFQVVRHFTDNKDYFISSLWQVLDAKT
jgi:L-histidine Nalpha-methyltransferase